MSRCRDRVIHSTSAWPGADGDAIRGPLQPVPVRLDSQRQRRSQLGVQLASLVARDACLRRREKGALTGRGEV